MNVSASATATSRVTAAPVLRLEECRQQTIHLEQPLGRHLDASIAAAQLPCLPQAIQLRGELSEDVDAELPLEVVAFEPPGLQLQDQLADEQLARRHWQCP